ncbi:MAG: Fpg/Nei family DNA glycosylase [Deltaproteobacteria bacterium]|nr:Fpg/Nei family DNA glycosylase [Deltaproteobacteria bacterium]
MPEGDTLHRTARVVGAALEGGRILAAEVDGRRARFGTGDLMGRTVLRVEARGKNLLLFLDDRQVLWSHLRMTGSWHVYRPGEPWHRPARQRTVALSTERAVVVGFNLPVLERMAEMRLESHPQLASLGPDLLSPGFDAAAAVARFRAVPWLTLGEALVDQRLASGVGNVYKSEVLHLCRVDPWRKVESADDALLAALLQNARALMLRNLDGRMRRTAHAAGGERYFVYGREGLPCRTCEAPIAMARQGEAARSTYFCPVCQQVTVQGRTKRQPFRPGC